jgi:hypothetical protein
MKNTEDQELHKTDAQNSSPKYFCIMKSALGELPTVLQFFIKKNSIVYIGKKTTEPKLV